MELNKKIYISGLSESKSNIYQIQVISNRPRCVSAFSPLIRGGICFRPAVHFPAQHLHTPLNLHTLLKS